MKRIVTDQALGCVLLMAFATYASAQDPKAEMQKRIAAVKESMAANQAQLKQYAWTETTEVSLKGEVKKRDQHECRYGPDGKVTKTAVGAPPEESKGGGRKRGLKNKIVENKIEDMKEYMDRIGSLIHRYVPPDPQTMQTAFQSGKASLDKGTGTLVFSDYAKPGDKVSLVFDPAAKKLRSFNVNTYLDSPDDKVTLTTRFSGLADGTNFLEETVLDASAKQIQIKTTNSGHHK